MQKYLNRLRYTPPEAEHRRILFVRLLSIPFCLLLLFLVGVSAHAGDPTYSAHGLSGIQVVPVVSTPSDLGDPPKELIRSPYPTVTYRGPVRASAYFTPTARMTVTAWIDGSLCGQGILTNTEPSNLVYVVDVLGDGQEGASGCGAPGRRITFQVGPQLMAPIATWGIEEPHPLALYPVAPPDAADDTAMTDEDTPVVIGVRANDLDPDGDALTITLASAPTHGRATLNPAAAVVYTPALDYYGSDAFDYTINDAHGLTDKATVRIIVSPVNDAPSFVKGPDVAVDEDAGRQIVTAWANNLSPGPPSEARQMLSFVLTSDNDGLFAVQPAIDPSTGDLTYTPAPDAQGRATVTATLRDGGGTANGGMNTSIPQTFGITIRPVNDPPSFTKGTNVTINEDDGPQTLANWATRISPGPADEAWQTLRFFLANDNDDLFTAPPALDPSTGDLTYSPVPDAHGRAVVTVTLRDSGGTANGGADTSFPQTFEIIVLPVNDAPSFAKGAHVTANEDAGPQTVASWASAISPGPPSEARQTLSFVLTSDDDDLFTVQPTIDPSTGDLAYTPAPNAQGRAAVTVTLRDGGGTASGGVNTSAPQTFAITVEPINDPPSFIKGVDVMTNEDAGPQTLANWATRISPGPTDEAWQALSSALTNDNPDLFALQPTLDPSTGDLTYASAPDAHGSAVVTVTLRDGGGTVNGGANTSPPQTFGITVKPVNDAPSFASGSDVTVDEDAGPQTVASWATHISPGPADETWQTRGFILTTDNTGLFAKRPALDASTGDLTYTPAPDAYGRAVVTAILWDSGGKVNGGTNTSAAQAFTITVNSVNDVPNAMDDRIMLDEDSGANKINALANDTCAPDVGEELHITTADPAEHGKVTFSHNSITYTPTANYSGLDSFTYAIEDGNGGADSATVHITIVNVNDAPTAGDDGTTVAEDSGSVAIDVLGNDDDPDGDDTLTISLDVAPVHGGATINDAATFVYTPAPDFCGSDAFTYIVSDGALTATAIVTVVVTPVSDPPAAEEDVASTDVDTPVIIDLLANDDDPDGRDTITVTQIGAPAHGSAAIRGTTAVLYTPELGFRGSDVFTYTISDADGFTDVTTVTVRVAPEAELNHVYLPLTVKNCAFLPDLTVERFVATAEGVQVVINNRGNVPVHEEFWVDVYVHPNAVPTGVNQIWSDLSNEGMVWSVTADLGMSDVITLTVGDGYYQAGYSHVLWPLRSDARLYVQLDSANAATPYGSVLERHEALGKAYNNIVGPVYPSTSP